MNPRADERRGFDHEFVNPIATPREIPPLVLS
jgi:hypothetical protein